MSGDWSALRVMDGGLGMYAEEVSGHKIDGNPLWSGRLVRDDPQLVKSIHTEFLDAGADLVETISYQLSVQKICEVYGKPPSEASQLITDSVHLARDAVEEAWPRLREPGRLRPLVAGSIGPFGASLCDKSEYSGDYVSRMTEEELKDWHRPRVLALAAAGTALDLLAFDSLPAVKEAEAVVSLLREFPNQRAWISFSSHDGERTCRGEELRTAAEAAAKCESVVAVGVNCCLPPRLVSPALSAMKTAAGSKFLIAFPNTGQRYNADTKTFYEDAEGLSIADCVSEWVAAGCRWIGGCCGSRPADIAAIARKMNDLRRC